MSEIHPTAIVSPKAKIGNNIKVHPYAIIHDDVEIGNDCVIGPYAVVYNGARIGNKVYIHQSAVIANVPQDLKFGDEKSYVYIGDNTTIREFVTIHRGTGEGGFSKVGENCLLMAYVHIPHDCIIGNNVILANTVQIAGHVEIDDNVIVGGVTAIHQFCKVGKYSMIGAATKITQDVPPFVLTGREPMRYMGLNVIGLRRRGFSGEDISTLKKVYSIIYDSGLTLTKAKEKIAEEYGDVPSVKELLDFLQRSNRGIIRK
ncbi:MAG: acyl-ACP--UDP-N-acetylglucosamine O-acyltransferase [Melioribacteraceae bacterium]|nr:MAG: acyl-ACP--UDP-N-acetylglucosamine O-acyltransferase [Melioribacteraceae bacterium]